MLSGGGSSPPLRIPKNQGGGGGPSDGLRTQPESLGGPKNESELAQQEARRHRRLRRKCRKTPSWCGALVDRERRGRLPVSPAGQRCFWRTLPPLSVHPRHGSPIAAIYNRVLIKRDTRTRRQLSFDSFAAPSALNCFSNKYVLPTLVSFVTPRGNFKTEVVWKV